MTTSYSTYLSIHDIASLHFHSPFQNLHLSSAKSNCASCPVPRVPCPAPQGVSHRDDSDDNSVFYVALRYKTGHVEEVHSPRTDETSSSFPLALSTNNRPIGDL